MATLLLRTPSAVKAWRKKLTGSVGFVPTMGALHAGHRSLLQKSVAQNAHTLLSIFVNPTQFDQKKDLAAYPVTFEADQKMAEAENVSAIFFPEGPELLYPDEFRYEVREKEFSQSLCGEFRPGHFTGMLTVVLKLFQLAQADFAYFGEKDYQQLQLVQGMVEAFFLPVHIVPVETVREASGLAMSSRNQRLSDVGKKTAAFLYQALREYPMVEAAKNFLQEKGFSVEYLVDQGDRRLVAAHLEGVRLIDNVPLRKRTPL